MIEKVTKKSKDAVTTERHVSASLDVRSLPRWIATVTVQLDVDQIANPSYQTDTLIAALRQLKINEKAQIETLHKARQIVEAETERIKQCERPVLRISYESNYAELEVALYDDYKVEPIRSYRSETASVTVNTDTASRLVEDGRSLSLPSTVDRIITTSTNNGAVKITTHTEQTVDSQIVSKDADSFITMADAFAMAADIFKVANSNEKRQILSMLLSNLYFDGENLTYTLKEPLGGLFLKKRSSIWQGRQELNPYLRFWRPLY